jgi:universal stress protein A
MTSILVPLDFSDCAPKLLDEAIRFARAFGAELLLLHVSDPPRSLPLNALVQPRGAREPIAVEALLRADADAHLGPMVQAARERGIEAEARVAFGRIADVIREVATRERVDMIVMGTHGRTGLARATIGSIAEEVLRHADVPVVTVRTRHHAGCAASSCASCALGESDVEHLVDAEGDG